MINKYILVINSLACFFLIKYLMNYISLIQAVTGVNYAPYYKWTDKKNI